MIELASKLLRQLLDSLQALDQIFFQYPFVGILHGLWHGCGEVGELVRLILESYGIDGTTNRGRRNAFVLPLQFLRMAHAD